MSSTPDRFPGPLIEDEEIILETNPAPSPSVQGAMRYDGAAFVMKDALGDFNPRDTSGLPLPSFEGQILFSHDGALFRRELPITSEAGWLVDNLGIMVIVG